MNYKTDKHNLELSGNINIEHLNEIHHIIQKNGIKSITYKDINCSDEIHFFLNNFQLSFNKDQDENFLQLIKTNCQDFIQYLYDLKTFLKNIIKKENPPDFLKKFFWNDVSKHLYNMGVTGIGITSTLHIALGSVIALQAIKPLSNFGAELFGIELLIIAFFRELGPIISSVILAARSGSSTIFRLGSMKISEEWDSLKVLQINPIYLLVKPRIISFIIASIILSYIASLAGLIGGYFAIRSLILITPEFFLKSVQNHLKIMTFFTGLWKAPIFGLSIAIICCFEGIKTKGSSRNIGIATTRGIVLSISSIIIIDTIINFIIWRLY